jgi:hypothetical protein
VKCATCGRPIVPCDGLPVDLARGLVVAGGYIPTCRFGGYIHADARTRRAGSHLCGRDHGTATAQPRQETRAS